MSRARGLQYAIVPQPTVNVSTSFVIDRVVNVTVTNNSGPPAAPTTTECPFCLSTIPLKATRCGHCTSEIKAV